MKSCVFLCFIVSSISSLAMSVEDYKTAYELSALAADAFLRYKFNPQDMGKADKCSLEGGYLCRVLLRLTKVVRQFKEVPDDIKNHVGELEILFRMYDVTGNEEEREKFSSKLINLLEGLIPHLILDIDRVEGRHLKMLLQQVKGG